MTARVLLQGMSFTNTSPLMGPTRAKEVSEYSWLSRHVPGGGVICVLETEIGKQ
jgi:hypothetical protein